MSTPEHRFDLEYLVDNGQHYGWPVATEPGCRLVRWLDDDTFSVLDAEDKPLGWGETQEEAVRAAQMVLTDRRRKRDGVIPASYSTQGE